MNSPGSRSLSVLNNGLTIQSHAEDWDVAQRGLWQQKTLLLSKNGFQGSGEHSIGGHFACCAARCRSATTPPSVPTTPARPGKAVVGMGQNWVGKREEQGQRSNERR